MLASEPEPMVQVCVSEELPASAAAVWTLIQDFGDLSAWAPTAIVTSLEGSGEGAVRQVKTDSGGFKERCEAHDPEALSFSYRLLESPMAFEDYVAVVTLSPLGEDRCSIEWKSTFTLRGVSDEDAQKLVESVYRDAFIASLRKRIETGS